MNTSLTSLLFWGLFALLPIATVLLLSEYLWRKKVVKGERARKFIHILAGIWMAFWPFYISFEVIFLLGAGACAVLLYSRFSHVFHAIYAVKRRTYGELFFAAGIMVCAFLGREAWVFTTSILLLALADGGAAVVGRVWGTKNQYKVFGSKQLVKSREGTAAFFGFACISVAIGIIVGGDSVLTLSNVYVFLLLPLGLTALENISPYGLDNVVTPANATIVLNSLL